VQIVVRPAQVLVTRSIVDPDRVDWSDPFWAKVHPDALSGCWLWHGAIAHKGYGSCRRSGRGIGAHRVAYELVFGPIPHGMLVCHRCDVPPCVNPLHLFLGTVADNSHDMVLKGRGKPMPGSESPLAKLSSHVEEVLSRVASGESYRSIGRSLGVRHTTVRSLVLGLSYKTETSGRRSTQLPGSSARRSRAMLAVWDRKGRAV
jgi:hypothetical protein